MSLLQNDNVNWYHPLDNTTEYTKDYAWTAFSSNVEFTSSGIITSGLKPIVASTTGYFRGSIVGGGYDLAGGYTRLTTAFWISGIFNENSYNYNFYVGLHQGNSLIHVFHLRKFPSNSLTCMIEIQGVHDLTKSIPLYPHDGGWHFVVLDGDHTDTNWRLRVSIDGSGWQDLGLGDKDTNTASFDNHVGFQLRTTDPSINLVIDESVWWFDAELFTDQELSNLYELANTYSLPMSQYDSVYGTPHSSGTNLFLKGHLQTSGNTSLYIPGQVETKSTDLFTEGIIQTSGNIDLYTSGSPRGSSSSISLYMLVPTPSSGNTDLYITGQSTISDNVNQYIQGYEASSENISLYVSGVPHTFDSSSLYIQGPLPESGNVDDFIWGHKVSSGNTALFLAGAFPRFDAFVSVVQNSPSKELNLFIHGIPLGSPTIFYTNDTVTLFIKDLGLDTNVDRSWPSFVKVPTAVVVPVDNTWISFVRGGNTSDDSIGLYTYGHASGSPPHGTLVSGSVPIIINGQSILGGEEGLLSDGYYAVNVEFPAFSKVHLGLIETFNLYISGTIVVTPPSSSLDLFTFGILDTTSGSFVSYIFGQDVVNDNRNLFVFGIQDIESGNIPFYIEVTDIGLSNKETTLYSHGY